MLIVTLDTNYVTVLGDDMLGRCYVKSVGKVCWKG